MEKSRFFLISTDPKVPKRLRGASKTNKLDERLFIALIHDSLIKQSNAVVDNRLKKEHESIPLYFESDKSAIESTTKAFTLKL